MKSKLYLLWKVLWIPNTELSYFLPSSCHYAKVHDRLLCKWHQKQLRDVAVINIFSVSLNSNVEAHGTSRLEP